MTILAVEQKQKTTNKERELEKLNILFKQNREMERVHLERLRKINDGLIKLGLKLEN